MMKEFGYFNLMTRLRRKKGKNRDTKSIDEGKESE